MVFIWEMRVKILSTFRLFGGQKVLLHNQRIIVATSGNWINANPIFGL
jgi:hypothetical protein